MPSDGTCARMRPGFGPVLLGLASLVACGGAAAARPAAPAPTDTSPTRPPPGAMDGSSLADAPVLLRLRPRVGSAYDVRFEMDTRTEGAEPLTTVVEGWLRVVHVDEATRNVRLTMGLRRVAGGPAGRSPASLIDERLLQPLRISWTSNDRGRRVGEPVIEGAQGQTAEFARQLADQISNASSMGWPEQPVRPGDRWSQAIEDVRPVPGLGQPLTLRGTANMSLVGVEPEAGVPLATIRGDVALRSNEVAVLGGRMQVVSEARSDLRVSLVDGLATRGRVEVLVSVVTLGDSGEGVGMITTMTMSLSVWPAAGRVTAAIGDRGPDSGSVLDSDSGIDSGSDWG
ncbi:MAG: hypothetical protein NZ898_00340 [Myxococcota bacterium]|nr:hypothetical protein [Myxococcota bacterium]MDW8361992.1 hypothetical protein [Myxococcales bacterium]